MYMLARINVLQILSKVQLFKVNVSAVYAE